MKFNVTVPCKPYVKRFLENNYGNPVDFRNHPRENEMFNRMLKKPCYDAENKFKNERSLHADFVEGTSQTGIFTAMDGNDRKLQPTLTRF